MVAESMMQVGQVVAESMMQARWRLGAGCRV